MNKNRYLIFFVCIILILPLVSCGEKKTLKQAEPEFGVYRFEAGYVSGFSSYIPDKDDIYDPISRTEFRYEKDRFYVVELPVEKGSDLDIIYHLATEEKTVEEYAISDQQWEKFPYSDREWDKLFWVAPADVPEELLAVSKPVDGKTPIMLSIGKNASLVCQGDDLYYLRLYDAPASDPNDQYVSLLYRLKKVGGSSEIENGKYSPYVSYEHPYGNYSEQYALPENFDKAECLFENECFRILVPSSVAEPEKILEEYSLDGRTWEDFSYTDREWDSLFYPSRVSAVPEELLDLSIKDGNNEARVLELSDEVFLIFKNKELYYCEFIQTDEREPVPKAVRFFLRLQKKS